MAAENLLSEPRSFLGTAVMFGAVSALPWGVLMGLVMPTVFHDSIGHTFVLWLGGGLVFGLVFGTAMAFFFRGATATIEDTPVGDLRARVDIAVSQIAYHPASRAEGFYTYKPSWQAGLLAGRIAVSLSGGKATIVGPKIYVERLHEQPEASDTMHLLATRTR